MARGRHGPIFIILKNLGLQAFCFILRERMLLSAHQRIKGYFACQEEFLYRPTLSIKSRPNVSVKNGKQHDGQRISKIQGYLATKR